LNTLTAVGAGVLGVLLWLSAPPSRVRADPFHFQGIPLGQRALGFGGAFTGVADDPSASYYNPAGLVHTGDSALSASLTLNAFDRQTIVRGFRTSFDQVDLKHDSDPSLPVSGGFLKRLGKRDKSGERAHAIGVSTYAIDQRQLSFDVQTFDPGRTGVATLSVDRSWRTLWNGLSYAYRFSEKLSFGVSGFLSTTRNHYREEQTGASLGSLLASGAYDSNAGAWASYRVNTNVKNLVARLGVLYQYNEKLRLGMMVQPPSIHVRGRASVRQRTLKLDATSDEGSFLNVEQGDLPSHYPLPFEVRLGGSYKLYDWFTLSLDTSFYGRAGSKNHPVIAVGRRAPDPETGAVAEVGHFELESWYRRASGNVSVGAEWLAWNWLAVRAGFFTSLSAAPSVPRQASTYYAPDINRYGGALSLGITAGGYDLSVGSAGLFGKGDAQAYDTTAEAGGMYQRTTVREATLFIFLTGIRNAVGRLAKHADEKLQQLGAKRKASPEGSAN
jgi:hypothetical protein